MATLGSLTPPQGPRFFGFPVQYGGFGELHTPFFAERRTRGLVERCVAGNPVREMAKVCELSELSRLSRRIRRFLLPSALADRDRWRTIGRCGDRGRSGNEK